MESTVSFKNGEIELRGIMHRPDRAPRGVGVILLCPGYKHRVGQTRLYVHIARSLCSHGYPVLRFDFHGLGESDGEIRRCLFGEFWRFIETGGFVSDTVAAVDFFRSGAKTGKVVLMGLCGGAITGLIAGAEDPRVDGLILINVPVMLDSGSGDWFVERMTPGFADSLLSDYLRKIVSLHSWLRVLSFKSDYRLIWKSISSRIGRKCSSFRRPNPDAHKGGDPVSPYFFKSFQSYTSSRRPLFFIFSGNDLFRWAFEADFQQRFLQDGNPYEGSYSIFVVDGANHAFTTPEWMKALLDKTIRWLDRNFTAHPSSEPMQMEGIEITGK